MQAVATSIGTSRGICERFHAYMKDSLTESFVAFAIIVHNRIHERLSE